MLFNSAAFIFIFLPATLAGCYLLAAGGRRTWVVVWLTLCSLVYYGWFKWEYLGLIAVSITFNYFTGERILASGHETPAAKRWLVAGLIFNLGLLAYFKYFNFFIDNVNAVTGWGWSVGEILLPIGISFFTFQKIAYLMDCRAGVAHRTTFLKYTLFVCFFPQLIAGPIVHPNTILPQFEKAEAFHFHPVRLAEGLTVFILGLGKKVVLADTFGIWAAEGFGAAAAGNTLGWWESWAATVAYTLQLYFDFSGYSDMAIGLGWMMGIRLPVNFNAPYQATSMIDFWRRWHMTLSAFLRDYLYIPLGETAGVRPAAGSIFSPPCCWGDSGTGWAGLSLSGADCTDFTWL